MTKRDLSQFQGLGYDKGGPIWKQAVWHVVSYTVFQKWWFPIKARPAVLRLFGATIGDHVRIREDVKINLPWKLTLGDHCWVGDGARLLTADDLIVGRGVCISQDAFICTGGHDPRSPTFEFITQPVVIEDGAWVAADALVMYGVTIGAHAVVGARAVVTKDVEPEAFIGWKG